MLVARINNMIHFVTTKNRFDVQDMVKLLKDARNYIDAHKDASEFGDDVSMFLKNQAE